MYVKPKKKLKGLEDFRVKEFKGLRVIGFNNKKGKCSLPCFWWHRLELNQ